VLGCPLTSDSTSASGNPPNGNGCANRQSVSHSSDDHEQVQTVRLDYNLNEKDTTWIRILAGVIFGVRMAIRQHRNWYFPCTPTPTARILRPKKGWRR
jgi:hypothetical protein